MPKIYSHFTRSSKSITWLLILILCVSPLLVACNQLNSASNSKNTIDNNKNTLSVSEAKNQKIVDADSAFFASTALETFGEKLPDQAQYTTPINSVLLKDIVIVAVEIECSPEIPLDDKDEKIWAEYERQRKLQNYLFFYDLDGNLLGSYDLSQNVGARMSFYTMVAGENNSLYLLANPHPEDGNYVSDSLIYKVQLDGAKVKTCDKFWEEINPDQGYYRMIADPKGDLYLFSYSKFIRLDKNGQITGQVNCKEEDMVRNIFIHNQKLYFTFETQDKAKQSPPQTVLGTANWDKKTLEVEKPIRPYEVMGYTDTAVLAENSIGIFQIDIESGEQTEWLLWQNTDYETPPRMNGSVRGLSILSENLIVIVNDEYDNQGRLRGLDISLLKRQDSNPNASKTIITIDPGEYSLDYNQVEQIYRFNHSQKDYLLRIEGAASDEALRFDTEVEIEQWQQQKIKEMTNGFGADLVLLKQNELLNYGRSGLLVDINDLIDQDKSFKKEDYQVKFFDVGKINQKIYGISSHYTLMGLVISKSFLGDQNRLTLEELSKILKDHPEKIGIFQTSSDMLFSTLLSSSIEEFIDFSTAKADLNNSDMIALLEFCQQSGANSLPGGENPIMPSQMANPPVLSFLDFAGIGPIGWAVLEYQMKSEITLSNYPSTRPSAARVSAPLVEGLYCISQNSPNQAAAWAFIKFLLSETEQDRYIESDLLPVLTSSFEKQIGYATTGQKLADNYLLRFYFNDPQHTPDELKLSPEGEKAYRQAINDAVAAPLIPKEVYQIINEEASSYFNGSKSAAEVTEIMQNRVQTLLNEMA